MTDGVLVVAEHRRGELRSVSRELLTAGQKLADARDGDLHVAIIGGHIEEFADRLDREGVDAIHTVDDGAEFNPDVYAAATTTLFERLAVGCVVMPHSANGMDYAPAVASRLSLPLVTDVTGVTVDDGLTVTRERYGGKVETTVAVDEGPVALTLRPHEWPPAEGRSDVTIEAAEVTVDSAVRSRVQGFEEQGPGEVDIDDAECIVAVGRGVASAAALDQVTELAAALDAPIAASRPAVDAGLLPKSRLVGQSGWSVRPTVYLALGISGAPRHVSGIRNADTVIAVNTDPDAPIFDVADYGVVGDLTDIVPALTEQVGDDDTPAP